MADGTRVRSMRLALLQNDPDSGPGRFLDWLPSATLIRADEGAPIPAADQFDAFVLLGGGFMPDADAEAPWLPAERSLIRAAVARQTPLLGICLGAQLLAHTCGGQVRAAYGLPEKGVTPLRVSPAAADDPLFGPLPGEVVGVESHEDQITQLPAGATWLMSSRRVPHQAFRVGSAAWGVQFHPEASGERVAGWSDASISRRGFDPDTVRAEGLAAAAQLEQVWAAWFARFVELADGVRRRAR